MGWRGVAKVPRHQLSAILVDSQDRVPLVTKSRQDFGYISTGRAQCRLGQLDDERGALTTEQRLGARQYPVLRPFNIDLNKIDTRKPLIIDEGVEGGCLDGFDAVRQDLVGHERSKRVLPRMREPCDSELKQSIP